jgi:hypothetical protein
MGLDECNAIHSSVWDEINAAKLGLDHVGGAVAGAEGALATLLPGAALGALGDVAAANIVVQRHLTTALQGFTNVMNCYTNNGRSFDLTDQARAVLRATDSLAEVGARLQGAMAAAATLPPVAIPILSAVVVQIKATRDILDGLVPRVFLNPIVPPSVAEELPYDPQALYVLDQGRDGWVLTDGLSAMVTFDNEADAREGLAVARAYTIHGFIGRSNTRPNHLDYVFEYWAGPSGLPQQLPISRDAVAYDPANVIVVDIGAPGWRLQDGNHLLALLDNQGDALAALAVVKQYHKMCYIGRGNTRPEHRQYVMTYWQ